MDFYLALSASKLYQVYDSVPDEALFYYQSHLMAENTSKHDFDAVLGSSLAYGYGFPFWALTTALDLSIHQSAIIDIATHKAFFLSLKWVAFGLCATTAYNAKKAQGLILFSGLFISSSALFFYGKIFSPEFLTLSLSGATIFLIYTDNFKLGTRSKIALFLITISVLVKLTSFPLLLLFCMYYLISIRHNNSKSKTTGGLILYALVASALSLLPLLSESGRASFIFWNDTNSSRVFSLDNLASWITTRSTTWDMVPLSGAIGYVGALTGLAVGLIFWVFSKNKWSDTSLLSLAMIFSGVIGLLLSASTTGYLDWYLWIPAILIITGCSLLVPQSSPIILVATLSGALIVASLPETIRRINQRIQVTELLKEQDIKTKDIQKLFETEELSCKKNIVLASDMLAAIDLANTPSTAIVRMRDLVSLNYLKNHPQNKTASFGMLPPQAFYKTDAKQTKDITEINYLAINFGLAEKTQIQNLGEIFISNDMNHAKLGQANFDKIKQIGNFGYYRRSDISCN